MYLRHTLTISVLMIIALVGVNWYVSASQATMENLLVVSDDDESGDLDPEVSFFLNDRFINNRFDIAGIRIGMTEKMVKKLYPHAQMQENRPGEKMLTLRTKSGMISASFFTPKAHTRVDGELYNNFEKRIFRLRNDQFFTKFTEKDVMKIYGRAYGRPIEAKCERDHMGDTPRCNYRWWGGDGIELKVTIKSKQDINGKIYTLLTTIATSTTHQTLSKS
ncbi:MAG: hypothetical protein OQK24_08945 [Magnetovibrio sp.]|nr:hypothetical protein [Magnetovibrio sp.]